MDKVGKKEKERERMGIPGYCCYIAGSVNIPVTETSEHCNLM